LSLARCAPTARGIEPVRVALLFLRTVRHYIAWMCGRTTKNYTWEQIHAMYHVAVPSPIPNMQPRFNVCPTDPDDTFVARDGGRPICCLQKLLPQEL